MQENEPPRGVWPTGVTTDRTNRRTFAALAAQLLATLALPPATHGRHRRKRKRRQRRCGGIAGLPCPEGFACVDNPRDNCDPSQGGVDCSGICVRPDPTPCSLIRCAPGRRCCPLCGGRCLLPEEPCTEAVCGEADCNGVTCDPGHYCCNPSCQHCVALGELCTQEACPPDPPVGEPCGGIICPVGELCCNVSCGICTVPGEVCAKIACTEE